MEIEAEITGSAAVMLLFGEVGEQHVESLIRACNQMAIQIWLEDRSSTPIDQMPWTKLSDALGRLI